MKICMLPKKLARSFCYAAIVLMFLIPLQSIANVDCSHTFHDLYNDCTKDATVNCAWLRTNTNQCKYKSPAVIVDCGNGTKVYQCAQGDDPATSKGKTIANCSTMKATDCTQYHTLSNACKNSSFVSCYPFSATIFECDKGDTCIIK